MMLNSTYNSAALKGRISDETLETLRKIEGAAETLTAKHTALLDNGLLTRQQKRERFKLENLPDTAAIDKQIEVLRNEKTAPIDKATDADPYTDVLRDHLVLDLEAAKTKAGKSAADSAYTIRLIQTLVAVEGNTLPARIALSLPRIVTGLTTEESRQQVAELLYTDDDREKLKTLQLEKAAITANITGLRSLHEKLVTEL